MTSPTWSRLPWRSLAGAVVLVAVVRQTGSGPFVAGVRALDATTLAWGTALALVITVAGAWRWHLVARGLGVGIGVPAAVASCYRAQFLNTVLPGGILGDVHRGVLHGRAVGATGPALRAVAWERTAGQVVQLVLAVVVLLVLPSPLQQVVPVVAVPALVLLLAVALVARRPRDPRPSRTGRLLAAVHDDVRCGLLVRRAWPGVVVASCVATACHVATFVVAARAVGVTLPLAELLPLAVLVLVAAGLPLNLAGWGPREGMAAWCFAAAGAGAAQGVATAVAYGALVLVANLPGLLVLLAARERTAGAPRPVPVVSRG
jgi:uncharacterized membrane protein YbhN (UPF0104 family)